MSRTVFRSDGPHPPGDRQGASVPRDPDETLVGREADLRRIDSFLAGTSAVGGTLLISGDPGVGKTALLAAAASRAADAGMPAWHATAVQFEAQTSFSGLQQLLQPVIREVDQAASCTASSTSGQEPSRLSATARIGA
ncbi:ATP-binding protein [Streptomyces sp. R-74717]|uniref:AAA family ATPase n=1 Tax=Streptomyces sp. R-74717 TaxID=2969820 RepID=UPI0039B57BB4